MVMAGPSFGIAGEWSGELGALLLSDPKLGRLTTAVLPPRTSTPGTAGDPVAALPAPPAPGVGEIPPWTSRFGSDPTPVPVLPAPEPAASFSPGFSSFKPLPGPSP